MTAAVLALSLLSHAAIRRAPHVPALARPAASAAAAPATAAAPLKLLGAAAADPASRRFAAAVATYFDGLAEHDPEQALRFGLPVAPGRLTSYDRGSVARRARFYRAVRDRIAAVPAKSLPPALRLDRKE